MGCPDTGLKDFPVKLGFQPTTLLNRGLPNTDLMLDISWGTKSTTPVFNNLMLEEGDINHTGGSTTLRLQNNAYSLRSIQICKPLHDSFLTSNKNSCKAEIVMAFSSGSTGYVLVCIPIVVGSTESPSLYLEALRQQKLPGRPISLNTLLPKDLSYVSYSTCLNQTQSNQSTTKNVSVIVFSAGLTYLENSLTDIKRLTNQSIFPDVVLPDNLIAKSNGDFYTIPSDTEYRSKINYGLYAINLQEVSRGRRTDSTDAYKCVPLLPDQNVKDGRIIVDTEKGELLSQVLKERSADINLDKQSMLTPATVEQTIAIVIGVFIGLFVLTIIAYFIYRFTSNDKSPLVPWLASFFTWFTSKGAAADTWFASKGAAAAESLTSKGAAAAALLTSKGAAIAPTIPDYGLVEGLKGVTGEINKWPADMKEGYKSIKRELFGIQSGVAGLSVSGSVPAAAAPAVAVAAAPVAVAAAPAAAVAAAPAAAVAAAVTAAAGVAATNNSPMSIMGGNIIIGILILLAISLFALWLGSLIYSIKLYNDNPSKDRDPEITKNIMIFGGIGFIPIFVGGLLVFSMIGGSHAAAIVLS